MPIENGGLKMIPKALMEEGWYNGICRNNTVACWDGEKFQYLRYKFGYRLDTIPHFEDVKETGGDGFIPIERINRIDYKEINRIKEEVGY